jgi:hypothetical protein
MSFSLRIDSVENLGSETLICGRLTKGAYFGPQYVRLKDTAGNEKTTTILSHSLTSPEGWPVTADHDTQLQLYVRTPPPPFVVDTKSPLEGLGNVALRKDGIDLSKELSDPLFWGSFSVLHMDSESIERPYEGFLGLSEDEVNGYYTQALSPYIDSPTWPIFPLQIDSDRYVEIEYAGGAEYQDRVWIGSRTSRQRALLGYNSGHFSLPGLRPSELIWLLDRLEQITAYPAAGLLLVPMCYLPQRDPLLTEKLATLCARIPGANSRLAGTMAANMVELKVVPDAKWERRPHFGWCSNWQYSQRNPESPMSVLAEAEFVFINQFFAEAG